MSPCNSLYSFIFSCLFWEVFTLFIKEGGMSRATDHK